MPKALFIYIVWLVMTAAGATAAFAQTTEIPLPDWTYDGDRTNQEEWARLSPDYAQCEMGKEQSPIQISFTTPSNKPPLKIRYAPVAAKAEYNAQTLRVRVQGGNVLTSEATEYRLSRIEFHSPSEHMIRDDFYLVEVHLIHEDKEGHMLILAVFAKNGQANPALQAILNNIHAVTGFTLDPTPFLPETLGYFAYRGSLTFPPCTEGVVWRVLKEPIEISPEQLSALVKITGRNARLAQPVYMRTVEETR